MKQVGESVLTIDDHPVTQMSSRRIQTAFLQNPLPLSRARRTPSRLNKGRTWRRRTTLWKSTWMATPPRRRAQSMRRCRRPSRVQNKRSRRIPAILNTPTSKTQHVRRRRIRHTEEPTAACSSSPTQKVLWSHKMEKETRRRRRTVRLSWRQKEQSKQTERAVSLKKRRHFGFPESYKVFTIVTVFLMLTDQLK